MPGPSEALRDCHRLRRHIAKLKEEIERMPRQIKIQQTRATGAEKSYHEAQEALKKLKVAITTNEKTLKETHQLIDKYKRQLNEASGTKEFEALKHEIAGAETILQSLEETILLQLGQSEDDAAKLPEMDKGVKKTKEDVVQYEKDAAVRRQRLEEELTKAQQELKEAEGLLSGDIGEQYRRLVTAKGNDALSMLNDKTCSTCYTTITAQHYNDLRVGKLVICRACGRILYLPE